jgi:HK97 family phage major capsid protein
VGRLTPSQPIPLGTTVIPVYEGGIEAGPVAEGGTKPVGKPAMSHRTLAPQKFACIVIVSEEMAQANPLGMLNLVERDITTSIGRAIDLAIFHGRSAISGAVQPGWTFVNQTTVRETIPADADGTELGDTLLAGATRLGSGDPGYDLSGFAFDPRFRFQLLGARDAFDRPVFQQSVNLSSDIDSVFGIPAAYGRAVPGLIGASTDTGVKGVGGDWSKLVWGYAKQLTIKRSTEAVVPDGTDLHYLWAENKLALLVEAIVGWTVLDPNAFVAYDAAPAVP